ncbi:hypothetical protein NIES37_69740 (plasmid) [Tolypothrix tenuis PCC 7101]|uniref:Uncharacterized protein n=1 Tax=Tolypothrix tenuis PCC 7101 TaxID=231146 RepID=A0A1Z4NB62_9CYAN|nr:hypothetical protein [Aulosira sp. FACHB-113]BAZ02961.1 hypothetical protein NIES37_69740 [Tolypothrix tenuis PCC 7101]BAZ78116.1 hypothetical protein NIES50_67490 [Aulosira laxa NIES-50]
MKPLFGKHLKKVTITPGGVIITPGGVIITPGGDNFDLKQKVEYSKTFKTLESLVDRRAMPRKPLVSNFDPLPTFFSNWRSL